jgi:SAM-dependent methyltransferase
LDFLRDELNLQTDSVVADIGSGTGISSRLFVENGNTVFGVEPNDAMRAAGEKFLAGQGNFRAISGTAEATTLADGSVDLVIAAQAAHWFDLPSARAEALRILRRPAWAALIWNDRDAVGSEFARGYEQLLREFGIDYEKIRHRHGAEGTVAPYFGHKAYREARLTNATALDFPTLVARVNSASYMPQPDTPTYAPMLARLRALFDASERDGRIAMDYVTRVFYGEVTS